MKNNISLNIPNLLFEELEKRRLRNPSLSMRAFAKRLEMSHAAVSEIIKGKRRISKKLAERIADKLMLNPEQKELVIGNFSAGQSLHRVPKKREGVPLDMDQYMVTSDWFHFAILSLTETKNFKSDYSWIARRLEVKPKIVKEAVSRMARLGMIDLRPNGTIKSVGKEFDAPADTPSSAFRNAHSQTLDLAQKSLELDAMELQDFITITMAIDPKKIPEAKRRIRKFRDQLSRFLESGERTEVYKMAVQLIPLSKNSAGNRE